MYHHEGVSGKRRFTDGRQKGVVFRRLSVLCVLIVACAVATGCLGGEADFEFAGDGSGTFVLESEIPNGVEQALLGTDIEAELARAITSTPGVSLEVFRRAGQRWIRFEAGFDDGQALVEGLLDPNDLGLQIRVFSELRMEELTDDSGTAFAARTVPVAEAIQIDAPGFDSVTGTALGSSRGGASGEGVQLAVTLPGRVVSTNGEVVDEDRVQWRLDDPDVAADLLARAEPHPPLSPLWWAVLGAGALLVVGALLTFVGSGFRRSRSKGRTVEVEQSRPKGWGVP